VVLEGIHRQELECSALDSRGSANEALLDDLLVQTQCLEELSTLVRGKGGHTHLGQHLEDTLVGGLLIVGNEALHCLSVLGTIYQQCS
jgi:hypothetical protein